MERFWQAIDLGDNLGRCLNTVRNMRGMQAWVMAAITGLIAFTTFGLAWTFDIQSTIDATAGLAQEVGNRLPDQAVRYTALVVLGITFAPTLMELGGAMFAREGATPFQWLVTALCVFDLITDAPATTAFVNRFDWAAFGVLEWPAYCVGWVLWLGMSSFFFEMVCACAIVTTVALIFRGFARSGARARQSVA